MEELPSSKLGTKKHWDKTYTSELKEFCSHGDVGEVWFGEESEDRVLQWLTEDWLPTLHSPPDALPPPGEEGAIEGVDMATCWVLDLGTGNGHFLVMLAQTGFRRLVGVDYSAESVSLAQAVAKKEAVDVPITFAQVDLVGPSLPRHPVLERLYHVCHDKGTYDAISLSPRTARRDRGRYLDNVYRLLHPDGVFIITSCNWTEEELLSQCQTRFVKVHSLPTPSFSFGGKTGSMVTALVLKKAPEYVLPEPEEEEEEEGQEKVEGEVEDEDSEEEEDR